MDEMSKGMSQTGSTATTDKNQENDGKLSLYIVVFYSSYIHLEI